MNRDAPSNDNPNWLCLTPLTDADGRPLSIEERLRHAGDVLLKNHNECLDVAEAQIAGIENLTPEQRLRAFRFVGEELAARFEQTLTQIGARLVSDHRWMDENWNG